MIHLALEDLRRDRLAFAFSVLGIGVLVFAFLLLIPLSVEVTRLGEAGGVPQNLILIEKDVLQPELSRVALGLAETTAAILGDRLKRLDPVVFRILRIETHPVQLRGIDPQAWTTSFDLQLIDGGWPADDSEIVIGQLAAQGGGWRTGGEIEIYGRPFRVAGVAAGPGTKTQTIWMTYAAAHDLFGADQGAQFLVAHLHPGTDPVAARQDLDDGLRSIGAGYEVYFEDALLRQYGAALKDLRALSLLTTVIAVAAVSLGAHNLAWLAAEERQRLLGILRLVGFDRRAVGRYLVIRLGVITLAAYLLALAAAVAFIRLGLGADSFTVGGTQTDLTLSPGMAGAGLILTCAASLAGTWLSIRSVLRATPTTLLGRGPGGGLA